MTMVLLSCVMRGKSCDQSRDNPPKQVQLLQALGRVPKLAETFDKKIRQV